MSAAYKAKGKPLDTSRVWKDEDKAFTNQWKSTGQRISAGGTLVFVGAAAAPASAMQVMVHVNNGASTNAATPMPSPAHRPQTAPVGSGAMFTSIREPNRAELKRLEAEEARRRMTAPAKAEPKPMKCGCFG